MALDETVRTTIKAMRDRAEAAQPMSFIDVLTRRPAAEELSDAVVVEGIPWLLVYGIELQLGDIPHRHLSISHPLGRLLPGRIIIEDLIEAFGFSRRLGVEISRSRGRGLILHLMEPYRLLPRTNEA